MASSPLLTPILTGIATSSSQAIFTQSNANLSVNGFCFDISFTVPENYTGKWDFLKNWLVQISLRKGSGVGTQLALVSSVPLYSLLAYSDYIAGVSMESTTFTAGETARISGYIPIGFFGMGSRDALDIQLSLSTLPTMSVNFTVYSVFNEVQLNNISQYISMSPTGADQPIYNALELYYVGTNTTLNDNAVTTDEEGVKTVNVEGAIALSNAVGEFEFFTRFGRIWADPYGLSQNISTRVPNSAGGSLLCKTMSFQPDMLETNIEETTASREALIAKIESNQPEKYAYLAKLGLV